MEYIDQLNTYETQIYFASQNTKKWSPYEAKHDLHPNTQLVGMNCQ
jgi:hypothetical protein